ncbi:Carboxylesterase 2 [Planctomycetes bacterium Poly30]|uniref:Carboxylesterase 2 n=1 Tax=Saltatorellus ferox TaxID=2528018 RepID=A0A518EVI9_9BACT|nr:Carboxylesterase 2 [Planctomycetes bacterium Poly30]
MTTSDSLLDCVVLEPGRPATAAVVWLHGLGASGHDFPPIVPELGLPKDHAIRFVFPHAPQIPVTINGGMVMPAWYDILAMDFDRKVDEAGVRRSGQQANALIQRERDRGVAADRIVIAGFSQGGAIAFHAGLRYPERLAGILALSTYIAADCDLENERSLANLDIPILQCHGTQDPMVTPGMGEAARDRLSGLGYQVNWKTYPMQHQVCPQEIDAIGVWLREVLPG